MANAEWEELKHKKLDEELEEFLWEWADTSDDDSPLDQFLRSQLPDAESNTALLDFLDGLTPPDILYLMESFREFTVGGDGLLDRDFEGSD